MSFFVLIFTCVRESNMQLVSQALQSAAMRHGKIYFRPNGGNAGDALINVGFYSLAVRLGFQYEEVSEPFDYAILGEDDLLVLSGGGNIVPYWEAGSDLIRHLTQYKFPLLLMPQSVEGRQEVLALLRVKDTLFLRETYSFEYAQSLNLDCTLALDHDLAFSAVAESILNEPLQLPALRVRNIRKLIFIAYHYFRSRFIKTLPAFRTDRESILKNKKNKINDISLVAKFGTKTPEQNICSSQWLLKVISWYETVETDRLHVFVASVLVGTHVVLHDNAYYKIKGVYEFSVKDNPAYTRLVSLATLR
jgi:exopolysaccharide biosynthesis predicted pyruvyltransferase EpsI